MTTLTTHPVATLLERLLEDSEAAWNPDTDASIYWAGLSKEEQKRLIGDKTHYHEFYTRMKEAPLAVSRSTGQLLYMLARYARAQNIVEFGTSFGVSATYLASALRDNGGGKLITSEFEPSKVLRARQNLAEAGLDDLVEVREGDALQTLSSQLPETIDLLLLDGAKGLYLDLLKQLESRFRVGTLIIADDADYCPDYVSYVRTPGHGYMSVPLAEDIEMTLYLG
ncbi:O-methyltransferase [Paramixta manurensis]|uniref:O-methyltransferase n=1 Tax=Paramixta manurensis TaxID=2740817 RepID=A0A6M8U3H8_9GAMM|nr:O-methyltransferase [Erwiniaceae bacterium PD-1]